MAHTVSTTAGSEPIKYVKQLGETLLDSEMAYDEKIRRLFETETEAFGLEHGFFSHIDTDAGKQQFNIVHGGRGDLTQSNVVDLSDTYCRKTIADPDGTLAVSDAAAEGWEGDPAYERFGLGSYLGTTVTAENELYGTLCYANTKPRSDPLTDEELRLVELEAQWLGFLLDQSPLSPSLSVSERAFDISDPRSSRLDSVMNALMKPERRLVLLELLDEPTDASIASITREISGDDADTKLYHAHLPKLADHGYIEWDMDSKTVSRGPNYPFVEPVLRMLLRHTEPTFR